MRQLNEEAQREVLKHLTPSLSQTVIASAWGGAVSGAICGALFGSVVFLPASIGPRESLTFEYVPGLFLWGVEGALLGAILGIIVGLFAGLLLRAIGAVLYVHYISAVLGATIMGLFCSVGGPVAVVFGIISGALAGYVGGRKYQDRLLHKN